ncbi:MAG: hypothetical protein IPL45_04035 [Actinomycetales bacterium]|nr:hypothetical protein [Actinomycetales bacterium]
MDALVPGADRSTGRVNDVTGRGRHTSTSAVALRLPDDEVAGIDTPEVLLRAGARRSHRDRLTLPPTSSQAPTGAGGAPRRTPVRGLTPTSPPGPGPRPSRHDWTRYGACCEPAPAKATPTIGHLGAPGES